VMSSRLPMGVATTNKVPDMRDEKKPGEHLYCTIGGSVP
jgi:hypothetical protein